MDAPNSRDFLNSDALPDPPNHLDPNSRPTRKRRIGLYGKRRGYRQKVDGIIDSIKQEYKWRFRDFLDHYISAEPTKGCQQARSALDRARRLVDFVTKSPSLRPMIISALQDHDTTLQSHCELEEADKPTNASLSITVGCVRQELARLNRNGTTGFFRQVNWDTFDWESACLTEDAKQAMEEAPKLFEFLTAVMARNG